MPQTLEKRKRARKPQTCFFGQRKRRKLGKDQGLLKPRIAKLEELNRAASKQIYSPLERGSIRLVILHAGSRSDDIQCVLMKTSFSQSPPYDALSYV